MLAVNPHQPQYGFRPVERLGADNAFGADTLPAGVIRRQDPDQSQRLSQSPNRTPGKLSIGRGSNWHSHAPHGNLFTQKAELRVPLVAYRGTAPAPMTSWAVTFPSPSSTSPAPCSLSRKRQAQGSGRFDGQACGIPPQVPTFAEQGLEGYESVGWFGLVAPANTPPADIARLNAAAVKAMKEPALREKADTLGAEPSPGYA